MKSLLFFLFLLISPVNDIITGKIVGVSDGDTVILLTEDKTQIKVRLDGIDCPESHQAFGQRAKQFTSDFCFGKQAILISHGKDRYGRSLGLIVIGQDTLNYELLKAGYAWHYKQYNKEPRLSEMELQAKNSKLGLWVDPEPIAPWIFRRIKK